MNLLFLYGPPASGKLTVANELSKLTGYPVFHNHLTRDIVENIYPNEVTKHYDLVNTLRDEVLKYCATNGTSMIFTYVYDGPEDDEAVNRKVEAVTNNGGRVLFVELTASKEILLGRVSNESRKAHKKITDSKLLESLLEINPYSTVTYENVLKLDTSMIRPKQVAAEIIAHYAL